MSVKIPVSIDLDRGLISIFVGLSQRVNADSAPMKREETGFQDTVNPKEKATFGLKTQITPQPLRWISMISISANRGEKVLLREPFSPLYASDNRQIKIRYITMNSVQNELSSITSVMNWLHYRHSPDLIRKTERIAVTIYHKYLNSVSSEFSNYATATAICIARMFSLNGHHITKYEIATGCGLSLEILDEFLKLIFEMAGLDFCIVLLSIINRGSTPGYSRTIVRKFLTAVRITLKFYEYVKKPETLFGMLFEPRSRILMRNAIRSLCRGELEQSERIICDMVAENLHSDVLFLLSELYVVQGKIQESRDLEAEAVQLLMEENGVQYLKF